ncbi:PQQ-dependent sugar dehydrogenase [Camelliibacillus cellulosilyticus]|uniref:PQQ-dependent sugar dehydrogenase n=1 Tax=Camelliibacillus cellulosilyticus TaxID=2174486 RepID=A0ABV9GM52_9BACL
MSEGPDRPRKIDPSHIQVPAGFRIDVIAQGLTTPINLLITNGGEMIVADAGVISGNGKVLRLTANGIQQIADGFRPPLTGINEYNNLLYVAHRGTITTVTPEGKKKDIIAGLPSFGDHHNNRTIFGPDGKMYFGQGTATNAGVVGADNHWVKNHPFFHDYAGATLPLAGHNFLTGDLLTDQDNRRALTGAFSPFGHATRKNERVTAMIKASGSVLRANPDGSNLELVAWGLRNPFRMRFDRHGRLFTANHGMDERGSRPIKNSPDEFQLIRYGEWYGWPDYTGGIPITDQQFKPDTHRQPEFLFARHPMRPPTPFAIFPPHSAAMGFDFNPNLAFGPLDDVFIAEYGPGAPDYPVQQLPKVGHRVSHLSMKSGHVRPFAINRSGLPASATDGGGFERPIDVVFGPDMAMYIVDFGQMKAGHGVIWRIAAI